MSWYEPVFDRSVAMVRSLVADSPETLGAVDDVLKRNGFSNLSVANVRSTKTSRPEAVLELEWLKSFLNNVARRTGDYEPNSSSTDSPEEQAEEALGKKKGNTSKARKEKTNKEKTNKEKTENSAKALKELKKKELEKKALKQKELKEKERKEKEKEKEKKLKEKEKEEKLKEKAAKEKALKEKAAKERKLKEEAAKEKRLKEKRLKEKRLKEKILKEKRLKEKRLKEKLLKEKAAKEKALKEKQLKEKAAKAAKEKTLKEKAAKEKAAKENTLKETPGRTRKGKAQDETEEQKPLKRPASTGAGDKRQKLEVNKKADVWCVCQKPSSGHMVACDNKDCKLEWFHMKCVNLSSLPKTWYCPQCLGNRSIRAKLRAKRK